MCACVCNSKYCLCTSPWNGDLRSRFKGQSPGRPTWFVTAWALLLRKSPHTHHSFCPLINKAIYKICFFIGHTNLLFASRKRIYNQALSVGPFLKWSCRQEIKPHRLAFVQAIKESPTPERKKWPQLPCLAKPFTVFSADSIVRRLNSASGASVWVAEGNIELSASLVNRGLRASCAHHSLSSSSPRAPLSSSGNGIQHNDKVKELCEWESGLCKGRDPPPAGNSRGQASDMSSGGDVTLDFHKAKCGLFFGELDNISLSDGGWFHFIFFF